MGREDVKAIKDLMILDLMMHTRLPEQGKLRKRYIAMCAMFCRLYFYQETKKKKKKRKKSKSRMLFEVFFCQRHVYFHAEINFSQSETCVIFWIIYLELK